MKIISLAFFLLFAFSTRLHSSTADFVSDTDGNPLMNGGSYHIVPVFRGRGGGLELARTGSETCPLTVVQARSELSPGLPATLSSPLKILFIYEGMLLGINFTEVPNCVPKPSEWDVVEELPIGWSVKVEHIQRLVGRFKIEKYGSRDYKLVYCRAFDDVCADLGIHNRRLVVRDGNPLIVNFKKAIESSAKWNIV